MGHHKTKLMFSYMANPSQIVHRRNQRVGKHIQGSVSLDVFNLIAAGLSPSPVWCCFCDLMHLNLIVVGGWPQLDPTSLKIWDVKSVGASHGFAMLPGMKWGASNSAKLMRVYCLLNQEGCYRPLKLLQTMGESPQHVVRDRTFPDGTMGCCANPFTNPKCFGRGQGLQRRFSLFECIKGACAFLYRTW